MSIERRFIQVDLCCNDDRNGAFTGKLSGIMFGGVETLSLEVPDFKITFLGKPPQHMRIARRAWRINGYRRWFGNWCWDSVTMRLDRAVELVNYLQTMRVYVDCGETSLFHKWVKGEPYTLDDFADEAFETAVEATS